MKLLTTLFFLGLTSAIAAHATPRLVSIRTLESSFERMALQGVATPEGVLMLGGYTYPERSCLRELTLFSKDGTEETLGLKLSVGRNHFRAVSLGAKRILVIAGYSEDFGSLAQVELLDLAANRVEAWPWLKYPTELFSVAQFKDKIAVIGGLIAQGMTQTWDAIQIIDLKTQEVSINPFRLATSRFGHESIWLPTLKKVLIVGGKHVSRAAPDANGRRKAIWTPVQSMEFWDPATGEVTPAGDMTIARDRPTLHLMADGKVLILGGVAEDPSPEKLRSIELYDPITRQTQVVGQMRVGRMAATVLPYKGKGLIIAGGWVDNADEGKLIEYFDFESFKSHALGSAHSSRAEHVMEWLSDDKFVLAGGKDNFGARDPHSYRFLSTEVIQVGQVGE